MRKAAQAVAFLVPAVCLTAVAAGSDDLNPVASVALITVALGVSSFSLAGLYCTHQVRARVCACVCGWAGALSPTNLYACLTVAAQVPRCTSKCAGATYSVPHWYLPLDAQDLSPKYSSALLGLTNTAGAVPGIVGVAATGMLYDSTGGSWAAALFAPSAAFLLSGTLVYTLAGSNAPEDFDAPGADDPFEFELRVRRGAGVAAAALRRIISQRGDSGERAAGAGSAELKRD